MNCERLIVNCQLNQVFDWKLKRFLVAGIVFVMGLFALLPGVVLAQAPVSPTEAMRAANQSYEEGKYAEAAEIYETMVNAGVVDEIVYFNLGNAYYKQGDLGRAILNYRRAQVIDPRDSAAAENLTIARLQTLDQIDATNVNPFSNLVQYVEEWLTLREAAVLALFLWWIVSLFVVAAILSRRLRKYCLWVAGILGIFLLAGIFSMANRYYTRQTTPEAVVVATEVDVTSGPGTADQYVIEFNLHSGAEVLITDQRPGWRNIALSGNDFKGWVPAEAVEQVEF